MSATSNCGSPAKHERPEFLRQLIAEVNTIKDKSTSQSRLASIGQLSACIAHELNQPLYYFKTVCNSTLGDIENENLDRDELKNDLQESLQQLAGVKKIIDQLMYFSKPEDKLFHPIKIEAALARALILMNPKLKKCGVQPHVEQDLDLPYIAGMEVRIVQLFINLMQNGIDAMQGQPKKEIQIKLRIKDEIVQVCFSDNGPGIQDNIVERIFEPFFTTKDPRKNAGLGLSIVSEIVKEHDGRIQLTKNGGKGAQFVIDLPI